MTPAHRLEVLGEVRRRLEKNEPCFLVSTQCIEAGVDVDFPAVWRALGPYDAIVQAAGRCNRNGRRKPEEAQVHVFRAEDEALPPGVYQTATNQTELLRKMAAANPHDPQSFETYFRLLYQLSVPDVCEIQQHREQLRFEEVSALFNFIEADTVPLVVVEQYNPETRSNEPVPLKEDPSRTVKQLLDTATARAPQFLTPTEWRLLQPHIVSLSHRDKKTAPFVAGNARLVFRGDDPRRGLYRLVAASLYAGTLHGSGLDVSEQFGNFDYLL
jgi:CRISPR-associated endonuclease/helicase Cas3